MYKKVIKRSFVSLLINISAGLILTLMATRDIVTCQSKIEMSAFSRVLCHPLEEGDPVDNYIIKSDFSLDSRRSLPSTPIGGGNDKLS